LGERAICKRCARRICAPSRRSLVRILVINWQDRENPQGGGAELHLHEIFGRIAQRGHTVELLCSGWKNAPRRVTLDGIDVHRVGSRHTYPFLARHYYKRYLEKT